MPPTIKPGQLQNRLRQSRFRDRRNRSPIVEIRAMVPRVLAAEIELATKFIPGATSHTLIRETLQAHLPKPLSESTRLIQLIFDNWGQILTYANYPPGKIKPGPPVRIRDRLYYYEESVRLYEIRSAIEGFLKARGVKHPASVASDIYRYAPKSK